MFMLRRKRGIHVYVQELYRELYNTRKLNVPPWESHKIQTFAQNFVHLRLCYVSIDVTYFDFSVKLELWLTYGIVTVFTVPPFLKFAKDACIKDLYFISTFLEKTTFLEKKAVQTDISSQL